MYNTRRVRYDKAGQIFDYHTGELIETKNRLCVCTSGSAYVELISVGNELRIGKVVMTPIR